MSNKASLSYICSSFIELTRVCHQNCGYCSFRSQESTLKSIEQISKELVRNSQSNATEVVFISGEAPQEHPQIQIALNQYGFSSYAEYLAKACKMALDLNMIPVLSVGYPDNHSLSLLSNCGCSFKVSILPSNLNGPGQALEKTMDRNYTAGISTLKALNSEKIPYTVSFTIGLGETEEERLKLIANTGELISADPWLQDIRIIPFQPEPDCELRHRPPLPFDQVSKTVKAAAKAFPVHHVSVPPYLFYRFDELVEHGLNDLGALPFLTGDPTKPTFEIPAFSFLKSRLEKKNLLLYERGTLSTKAAINRPSVQKVVAFNLDKIQKRNNAGLNLIDNSHCFVCGFSNSSGLKIAVKDTIENHTCSFTFTPGPTYQGYSGIVHGGILSTLLDEAMAHAIMGNESNKAIVVTANIKIRFLKPAPIGFPMKVAATKTGERKNLFFAKASAMLTDGTVLAEAEGRFVGI